MTRTAERRPCKHCGRLMIVVADHGGTTQYLDAESPVFDVIKDPDAGEEFAVLAAASYVTHYATCPVRGTNATEGG